MKDKIYVLENNNPGKIWEMEMTFFSWIEYNLSGIYREKKASEK